MGKLRVGIIGAGGIAAKMHLPEMLEEADRCEVVLLSGRRVSRLRLLCEKFGVRGYTSNYEDVISDSRIDAVCIATPHPLHVEWGMRALAAGKHVFMQKPLCMEMGEADSFAEAVSRSDRTVLCLPHFTPDVWSIRRLIQEGQLGRISGARARTSHGGPEVYYREVLSIFDEETTDDLWFFDAKDAGAGALFDMGVYAVAQLVALLGSAKRVIALATTVEKPTSLEDTATIILQMGSGAIATAETGWCDPGRTWALSVHGTSAKVEVPQYGGVNAATYHPTALDRDDAPIESNPLAITDDAGSAHHHFFDCIEAGIQPPLSHVWAARHVCEILVAAQESSRTGKAVDLRTSAEAPV
jgi:predicted dehydrogenase